MLLNGAEAVVVEIGIALIVMIVKTPKIEPEQSVIIGNVGTKYANAAAAITLGSGSTIFNGMASVDSSGNLAIRNSSDKQIGNAYYKSAFVLTGLI